MGNALIKKDDKRPGIPVKKINYDNCDNVETQEIQLKGAKAKVDRVHINGLSRTKDDVIKDAVKDLFAAEDFEDVLFRAHKVKTKLESMGCFRNIAIYVDTSRGPKASPNGLEVTYNVKEFKRIVGGVNTEVGENEGFLSLGVTAPNLLGRGEQFQVQYGFGSRRTNKFNVSLIKPFTGKRNPVFTASLYRTTSAWPVSSYQDLNRGILLDFGINSFRSVRHNLQWDACFREISLISKTSSFDVREQSGQTLKSALRHILTVDLRDDVIFPNCGSLFQVTSELAGVGRNVGFMKNDAYFQTNLSLMRHVVLQASLSAGILNQFGDEWNLNIADMYYLGGPLSLRGFQTRGIGPRSEGDTLGSCWFWATGLHLYTPVPLITNENLSELLRIHGFLTVGNIGDYSAGDEVLTLERLQQNIRVSYGVGLAIRLGQMGRVELNYCIPHRSDGADLKQLGFQFGIGLQFL